MCELSFSLPPHAFPPNRAFASVPWFSLSPGQSSGSPQGLSASPVEIALGLSLNLYAVQTFLKGVTEKEGNQTIL